MVGQMQCNAGNRATSGYGATAGRCASPRLDDCSGWSFLLNVSGMYEFSLPCTVLKALRVILGEFEGASKQPIAQRLLQS